MTLLASKHAVLIKKDLVFCGLYVALISAHAGDY